jgi:flagellar basal body rod protein FlgC
MIPNGTLYPWQSRTDEVVLVSSISGSGSFWSNALQISASGLRDADLRLDVTANNVANSNTSSFIPDRVDSIEQRGGGVDSVILSGETPPDISNAPAGYKPPSQTDYPTEGVNSILAQRAFEANAKALKLQSDVTKNLIDEIA